MKVLCGMFVPLCAIPLSLLCDCGSLWENKRVNFSIDSWRKKLILNSQLIYFILFLVGCLFFFNFFSFHAYALQSYKTLFVVPGSFTSIIMGLAYKNKINAYDEQMLSYKKWCDPWAKEYSLDIKAQHIHIRTQKKCNEKERKKKNQTKFLYKQCKQNRIDLMHEALYIKK